MHEVMLLTSSLYVGGAERVVANLAQYLDPSQFRVTVAHLKERGEVGDDLAARGYDVVGIPRQASGLGRYLSFRSLRRVVRERKIDLLHTHTTYSLTDGALCRLAERGRVKLVHTFHFGNYPNLPRRYLMMERLASRAADHLAAVGVEQAQLLRSLYDVAPARISAILNGTANPPAPVDEEWARRLKCDGRVVVGTTATFIEQKGLDYLLQAAKLVEQNGGGAVFVVVGVGPLQSQLEERCREMGLEGSVFFTGFKPNAGATMTPLYDVLLQTSLWEAMSVVVLEAMAACKPVVVTDVGDNRHVVREGITGFVVAPRDAQAMAHRLRRLVDSKALREQLGRAGKQRFEERYTAGVMARAYEDLYRSVLDGRSPDTRA